MEIVIREIYYVWTGVKCIRSSASARCLKKGEVEEIHSLGLVRLNEVESSDKFCKIAKVTSGQMVRKTQNLHLNEFYLFNLQNCTNKLKFYTFKL